MSKIPFFLKLPESIHKWLCDYADKHYQSKTAVIIKALLQLKESNDEQD